MVKYCVICVFLFCCAKRKKRKANENIKTTTVLLTITCYTAATTQVKYNRKSEYLLASAHDKDVKIWDIRVCISEIFSFIKKKQEPKTRKKN